MLKKLIRYTFVTSDVFVGLFAFFGGMNAVMGVHTGFTIGHVLIGLAVVSFALTMLAAGYAVAKELAWQRVLRTVLYTVLLVAFGFLFVYKLWHSIPDRSFEIYALVFFLANLSGYGLWLRHTHQLR